MTQTGASQSVSHSCPFRTFAFRLVLDFDYTELASCDAQMTLIRSFVSPFQRRFRRMMTSLWLFGLARGQSLTRVGNVNSTVRTLRVAESSS